MPLAPVREQLPARARAHLEAAESELVYNPYATATWRLMRPDGRICFLKAGWAGAYPSLSVERERTVWLGDRGVPVPTVLDAGSHGDVEWMVTAALTGQPASASEHRNQPRRLVATLAEGLRAFHDTDPAGCPFDYRPAAALRHASARVAAGLVPAENLHPEHTHLTVQQAVARLRMLAPADPQDVVVCHGDYCLPNVFLARGHVTGYLDLGESGLAERWRDLAVATWSLTWNLGPGYEDLFLDAYGADWDLRRRDFYRLLYDLES